MNTSNTVDTVVGVIVCLATVIGLYLSIRSSARKRAEEDRANEARIEAGGIEEGKRSRDWEIAQLTAQLGDARNERDQARLRCDQFEQRLNDLRDRGAK